MSFTGTNLPEEFFGDATDEQIDGGGGADTLAGGAGLDVIRGGTGNDQIQIRPGDGGTDLMPQVGVDAIDQILDSAGDDTIRIIGVNPDDVRIFSEGNLFGLILPDSGGTEYLTFLNANSTTLFDNFEVIEFDDGTIWNEPSDLVFRGPDFDNRMTITDLDVSVDGGGGNDIYVTGAGDDTLRGGAGLDQMTGGAGSDTYIVGIDEGGKDLDAFTFELVQESAFDPGTDTLRLEGHTSANIRVFTETVDGLPYMVFTSSAHGDPLAGVYVDHDPGAGQDVYAYIERIELEDGVFDATNPLPLMALDSDSLINGSRFGESLVGGAGDDTLNGFGGDDTLQGGAGDDLINGGDGDDTFINLRGGLDIWEGGAGSDTLITDLTGLAPDFDLLFDAEAGLHGRANSTLGQDVVDSIENFTMIGDWNGDLRGNADANRLQGDAGDDTLTGRGGDDTLIGGAGDDIAVFDVAQGAATISFVNGQLQVVSAEGTDHLAGIETLRFTDGDLAAGQFVPGQTITGGGDPDTLMGDLGDDTILPGASSDSVSGGAGNDQITGGIGFDTVDAGDGDDTVTGGDGYDSVIGGAGDDLITGNNGFDTLLGGTGSDTLTGGLGTDLLQGGGDADLLSGQAGGDTLQGGDGADTLNGNAGADDLAGDAGDDLLNGGINNDTLAGGAGADTLNGGNGSDALIGGDGADRLEGNAGADTLEGGAGDDILRGGIGADTFVFTTGSGNDRIVDLSLVDTLRLDANLFTETTPQADDLRGYTSINADGFLVLTFGSDSLTFTGITNANPVVNAVEIF